MTCSRNLPAVDLATLLGSFEAGLIEHLPAIFWVIDEEGSFVRWNRRMEEVLGWTGEDLATMNPLELAVEEDRDAMVRHLEEVCKRGEDRMEVDLRHATGYSIAFHVTGRALEAGGRSYRVGVGIERMARLAKFDAAISKLGQRLSEATTPRSAGRIIADISRDLIGGDAFSITLYSPETGEVIPVFAMDTVDGVPTELQESFPAGTSPSPLFEEVLNHGSRLISADEGEFSQTTIPFGDTSMCFASLIVVPVRKGKNAIGVLSLQSYRKGAYSASDVRTLEVLAGHCAGALERLRVESALRIAEQRFAHAFEASPVAMFMGTYEDGRALAVNSAFVQVFGFSEQELIGKNGLELGIWENQNDREQIYQTIRSGQKVRDFQVRFLTKHRDVVHVLVSVETIEVEGERCLLFFNYDITTRVNLEEQLSQSRKLESIGQVTAGVAHDFNNLLTIIDGCSSLALKDSGLDRKSRDLMEQISLAAGRAGNLTRQLLAFSSRQKMVPRKLNLNLLLENLARMLQQLLGPTTHLELRYVEKLDSAHADAGMIEQVIINLVVNARDAMEDGGTLLLETAWPESDLIPPGIGEREYVCIRVIDTGIGIPPEHLSRLFEPFFTTKEIGKGNGLGLATAYGIVKQHGGWIDVRSVIGEGTTFLVYLPVSIELAEPVQPSGPPVSDPKGHERILVVEDEPAVRGLICDILEFYGYKILVADSGAAGFEIWRTHSDTIDAVVTDIVMPGGMDGREMARLILEERPDLPFLYLSGYNSKVAGQDDSLEEESNFLQKPFEASALAQAVRNSLDRKSASGMHSPG